MAAAKYDVIRSSHVRTFEMTAYGAELPIRLRPADGSSCPKGDLDPARGSIAGSG
jgi:hypothetical protein